MNSGSAIRLIEDNPGDIDLTRRATVVILTSSKEEQDLAGLYWLGWNEQRPKAR